MGYYERNRGSLRHLRKLDPDGYPLWLAHQPNRFREP